MKGSIGDRGAREGSPVTSHVISTVEAARYYHQGPDGLRGVHGLNVSVGTGEILGLSGMSGCGKSTALRLLAGIERPDSGTVLFGGCDIWAGVRGSSPRLPRPGYVMPVFQDPTSSLDPRWPIFRSITEPMTVGRRMSRQQRLEAAHELVARVGLEQLDVQSLPSQLSGGQCQRVAIVRALAGKPALLVADEPTASLDVTSAAGIMHLLRQTADAGTSIVIVSHDRRILSSLADRVLRLEAGHVVSTGPAASNLMPTRPDPAEVDAC